MNRAISAIVKKDMWEITANRQLLLTIVIVPLVLTLVVPSIFLLSAHFAPQEMGELQELMRMMPEEMQNKETEELMVTLLFDNILPLFFLIIPIMAASVMAASSFVGEKEQSTLETLLYSPLTVKQLFHGKVLSSFLFSMLVSWISFLVMFLVLGTDTCVFISVSLADCHHVDRTLFGEGTECDGSPTEGSISCIAGSISDCRTVSWCDIDQRLDLGRAGLDSRLVGVAFAKDISEEI